MERPSLRIVAYNFLSGGSPRRAHQWSRLLRTLKPDLVLGQECRPPHDSPHERFRPSADDSFLWRRAGERRWGTGLLLRGAGIRPISVPQYADWVVGGEVRCSRWSVRPVRVFSIHGPAGERGYVRTMNEILDRLARIQGRADLLLGGDFNVVVGYRPLDDPLRLRGDRRDLLDRLGKEFGLIPAWQTANPGRRLAQTLRWSTNPATPYHCDGIFIPRRWLPRLRSCRVVRGPRWTQLSDHNPVVVALEPWSNAE